ncbi:hypothetical protein ACJA23_03435 [Mycoplasma corogypsi]|uniref:hypothetical protein n=1 Tax=Mycoplasma corogypsi TaxID=2106 RepID=UPI0038737C0E
MRIIISKKSLTWTTVIASFVAVILALVGTIICYMSGLSQAVLACFGLSVSASLIALISHLSIAFFYEFGSSKKKLMAFIMFWLMYITIILTIIAMLRNDTVAKILSVIIMGGWTAILSLLIPVYLIFTRVVKVQTKKK